MKKVNLDVMSNIIGGGNGRKCAIIGAGAGILTVLGGLTGGLTGALGGFVGGLMAGAAEDCF